MMVLLKFDITQRWLLYFKTWNQFHWETSDMVQQTNSLKVDWLTHTKKQKNAKQRMSSLHIICLSYQKCYPSKVEFSCKTIHKATEANVESHKVKFSNN